jgi:hypothetical protein
MAQQEDEKRDHDAKNEENHGRDHKPPEPPGRIVHPRPSHGDLCH